MELILVAFATSCQSFFGSVCYACICYDFRMINKKQKNRISKLQELLDAHFNGNKTDLGKFLGYKDGAFVRQLISGERTISEKTIEKIEANRSFKGWFSTDLKVPGVAPDNEVAQPLPQTTLKAANHILVEIFELLDSTDEIGQGKALYAVKEIVQMRKALTDAAFYQSKQVRPVTSDVMDKIRKSQESTTERISEIVAGSSRPLPLPPKPGKGAKNQ